MAAHSLNKFFLVNNFLVYAFIHWLKAVDLGLLSGPCYMFGPKPFMVFSSHNS